MKSKKEGLYLTAVQVDKAVREFYSGSGCVTLSQVRNGTGFERAARTADMLTVSTWPSRGLFAEGIEIKVSTYDLRKELKDPAKADNIGAYCARWWLATPEGLTDDEMIPPNWGIIHVNAKLKAWVVKSAKHREDVKEMDALFVCSVLRNFAENHVHVDQVKGMVAEQLAGEVKREVARHKHVEENFEKLKAEILAWEKAHGLAISGWGGRLTYNAGEIGACVNLIRNLRLQPSEALEKAAEALTAAAAAIRPLLVKPEVTDARNTD